MTDLLPSEDDEQKDFIDWLELLELTGALKFTAIPNNTYTPHMSQKVKNRRMGLRAGLPDVLIAIPGVGIVFVEMKRRKKGVTSEAQKAWIEILNQCPGAEARVCKGADEAIKFVSELLPQSIRQAKQTDTTF
jgi:hypothetical protein